MNLYIVRHAWAEDGWDDRARRLTEEGTARFAGFVRKLAKREFAPRLIVTSPLVRCRQTADLLAAAIGRCEVVEREELAPGSDLLGLVTWMKGRQRPVDTAWVGHMPDVSRLTATLAGDGRAAVAFGKGAIACLECGDIPEPGDGVLRWLLTPKMLGC